MEKKSRRRRKGKVVREREEIGRGEERKGGRGEEWRKEVESDGTDEAGEEERRRAADNKNGRKNITTGKEQETKRAEGREG